MAAPVRLALATARAVANEKADVMEKRSGQPR
jgi:hypothetical protein